MSRYIWILEILNGDKNCYPRGAIWSAWEGNSYESRERARNALKSHNESCWTRARIRKYVPEVTR